MVPSPSLIAALAVEVLDGRLHDRLGVDAERADDAGLRAEARNLHHSIVRHGGAARPEQGSCNHRGQETQRLLLHENFLLDVRAEPGFRHTTPGPERTRAGPAEGRADPTGPFRP